MIKDYIEIPGVELEGPYIPAPQVVEINNLDIPQDDPATI
jgi:hypothetical protein